MRYDLFVLAPLCFFGCIANVIYHSLHDHQHNIARHCLDGVSFGLMMMPVLSINGMGPWTGVFLLRPWVRRSWGLVMFFFMIIGALFGCRVLVMSGHRSAQGALWGLLVGLSFLSATHQKWYHVAALSCALTFMILVYFFMRHSGCWLLWRDSFVAVMGVSSQSVAPGWNWKQKLLGPLIGSMLLGGLLAMDMLHDVAHSVCDSMSGASH